MVDLIDRAERFAREKHEGQFRKGIAKEPYIVHLEEVAAFVSDWGGTQDAIAGGLLGAVVGGIGSALLPQAQAPPSGIQVDLGPVLDAVATLLRGPIRSAIANRRNTAQNTDRTDIAPSRTATVPQFARIPSCQPNVIPVGGYSSSVGERGAGLSGGQRQRLAIARMILRRPRLLVLDEATSALDVDTERRLTANLMEAYKGLTVFFITHRLASLRHADTILVMDQGVLVEHGTHQELMDLDGRYATLFHQQEVG